MIVLAAVVGILASAPTATPPHLEAPAWERRATAEDMTELYPTQAKLRGQVGITNVECKVGADGVLEDCNVRYEAPSGHGFGDAALRVAQRFKMRPTTADGQSTQGGTVRLPLQFDFVGARAGGLRGYYASKRCYGAFALAAERDPQTEKAAENAAFFAGVLVASLAALGATPSIWEEELRAEWRQSGSDPTLRDQCVNLLPPRR